MEGWITIIDGKGVNPYKPAIDIRLKTIPNWVNNLLI
jgi:hypothetical protein